MPAEVTFNTCLRFLGFAFVLDSPDSSNAKGEFISKGMTIKH